MSFEGGKIDKAPRVPPGTTPEDVEHILQQGIPDTTSEDPAQLARLAETPEGRAIIAQMNRASVLDELSKTRGIAPQSAPGQMTERGEFRNRAEAIAYLKALPDPELTLLMDRLEVEESVVAEPGPRAPLNGPHEIQLLKNEIGLRVRSSHPKAIGALEYL